MCAGLNKTTKRFFQDVGCGSSRWVAWVKIRRKVVLFCSPFLGLTFLLFWFPWGRSPQAPQWVVGVHLIVALFLYDTMFTLVFSATSAMIAEATTKHKGRVRIVVWMEVAGILGELFH